MPLTACLCLSFTFHARHIPQTVTELARALVRYAICNEASKKPLRRDEINKRGGFKLELGTLAADGFGTDNRAQRRVDL